MTHKLKMPDPPLMTQEQIDEAYQLYYHPTFKYKGVIMEVPWFLQMPNLTDISKKYNLDVMIVSRYLIVEHQRRTNTDEYGKAIKAY